MNDRLMIAAMILQGSAANRPTAEMGLEDVKEAISLADALLEETRREVPRSGLNGDPAATPTLRELGVSGRAAAPLERMGIVTLAQLAVQTRADIAQVKGVSSESMKTFDVLLANHGLTWDFKAGKTPAPQVAETVSDDDDEDDDMEDVL
jgi:predicted flap endonuclease-1-like 5' DNA nuclease